MKHFFARLGEPSTWAGLSALGALFGLAPDNVMTVGHAFVAVAAAAAVVLPEKSS